MFGETTPEERTIEKLKRLDRLREYYQKQFAQQLTDEDLVVELIADAVYLATYFGIDFETKVQETAEDVRRVFPDIVC